MIKDKVLIQWNYNNKKQLENIGYKFTKYGDYFECKKEDLIFIKGSEQLLDCKCDYCGLEYKIKIRKYIRAISGLVKTNACDKCTYKKSREIKLIKYGTCDSRKICKTDSFKKLDNNKKLNAFNKMIKAFNNSDYILCPMIYINNEEKVPYVCKKHINKGIQWINWAHFQNNRGCKYCGMESSHDAQRFSYERVKKMVESNGRNKLVGNYTGYSDYNLRITCEDCGEVFVTNLSLFMNGKTKCNLCNSSKGEQEIARVLKDNNIEFIKEYEIYPKEWENPLRLDFYIPSLKLGIEYDGVQHFKPIDFKGLGKQSANKSFELQVKRDKIKNDYCKRNNIKLVRIPYTDFDIIEDKVKIVTKDMRIKL